MPPRHYQRMERFAKKVAAIVADPRNIAARTTYHLRFDFMGSSELESSGGMGLAWKDHERRLRLREQE